MSILVNPLFSILSAPSHSRTQLKGQLNYLANATALTKLPEAPAENQGCKFPDLIDEAAALEWAGVSLGKTEVYRLYLSIKTLADGLPGEADRCRLGQRLRVEAGAAG